MSAVFGRVPAAQGRRAAGYPLVGPCGTAPGGAPSACLARVPLAGFVPLSLADYPGCAAAVLFTQGCNLRCPFCHNAALLPMQIAQGQSLLDGNLVWNRLISRHHQIANVVISGGEPTLHAGLFDFLRELKRAGFRVKLDSNGTLPERLSEVLCAKLVDFVALDIKAPLDMPCPSSRASSEMELATGRPGVESRIRQSLALLQESDVEFEIRTTCHNRLDAESLWKIASVLPAEARWVLQRCRSVENYQAEYRSVEWLTARLETLALRIPGVQARGW